MLFVYYWYESNNTEKWHQNTRHKTALKYRLIFVFLLLTPFAFKTAIASFSELKMNLKWFVVNGVGTAFSQAAAYAAFALVYLGYATSVFRLSVLFIIILGGVFLKEERIKERLLGGAVMVLGTILLAL